jgi:delta-aminolevulinic acid dehydratase/porphobilinogen synthase
MKAPASLFLPSLISESVREMPYRRFTTKPEQPSLNADHLIQVLDVIPEKGKRKHLIGQEQSGHYADTLETIHATIARSLQSGVHQFGLRLLKASPTDTPERTLIRHAENLHHLTERFGRDGQWLVDPFSIALHPDLQWGVKDHSGKIVPFRTLELVYQAANVLSQSGADQFLTIGRINGEVMAAQQGIAHADADTTVASFSTNSETANAYLGVTAHNPLAANTGQKIIAGNTREMVLRGLLDFAEGTEVMYNKPIENFHVIAEIRSLLRPGEQRDHFLDDPETQSLLTDKPATQERVESIRGQDFTDRQIGAYVVSGTYGMYDLLKNRYGDRFTFSMLREMYQNVFAANGGSPDTRIMDRNATWYMEQPAA